MYNNSFFILAFVFIFFSCSPSLEEIATEHECTECRTFLAEITKLENNYHFYLIGDQTSKQVHDPELQNLDKRAIGKTFLRIVEEEDSEHLLTHLYCFIGYDMACLTQLIPDSIIESKTKKSNIYS